MHINKPYYLKKMKFRKLLFVTGLILFANAVYSQHFYSTYNWDNKIDFPKDSSEKKIILLEKEVVEYIYENNTLLQYNLKHNVEFINSNEEIENNNIKYIPYNEESEIIDARARVIKPNNTIIELDKSKILESYDEETGSRYKYFALEGMESGNIIEYYYVLKQNPYYSGTKKVIQEEYPILEYQFDLLAPENLFFEFMVLNDSGFFNIDTATLGKNHWKINLKNIPSLKDEDESPYNLLLKQFIYKLDRNTAMNLKDISSYGKVSQNVYDNMYNSLDKADLKSLNKLIKEIKVDEDADIAETIYLVENYIKTNIHIVDYDSEDLSKISSLINTKMASSFGITKLLSNAYQSLGINHQIILTSDRTFLEFDPDFEAYNYLVKYLLYFPDTDDYLDPSNFEYRYGLLPYEYTNNYGLFIRSVSLGDLKTGLGKIKFIKPYGYDKTVHDHDVKVVISEDFSQVNMNIIQTSLGYYAAPIQPYLDIISDDIKTNIIEETLENFVSKSEIKEWNIKNGTASVLNKKPLLIEFEATNTELIDIAGDKYLFKVGELIGPQVELYSEEKRGLPIYSKYKRTFDRTIEIEIPKGYIVKNINDLRIHTEYVKDNEIKLLFNSEYTVEDNIIKIDIHEFYDQIYFDLDGYQYYRNVVNSASDFNKIILIIEKANTI